jgi:hypothetical protein
MKIINTIIFFLFLNCNAQKGEKEQITQCFNTYKKAIITNEGKVAVKQIDNRTVKYYSEILEKIKSADSLTLNNLNILDKFSVLSLKHFATKEEILSFNGKDLFRFAITKRMTGNVVNITIGEITIENDFAKGQLLSNGKKTSTNFNFYKENGNWKINVTSMLTSGVGAIEQMIEKSGKSENDFIIYILGKANGKKPETNIWKPY